MHNKINNLRKKHAKHEKSHNMVVVVVDGRMVQKDKPKKCTGQVTTWFDIECKKTSSKMD
jgi:hypothetical protein